MLAIVNINHYIEFIKYGDAKMIDGNTAALNEHLSQQETMDYENEWKFDYIEQCIDAAMYEIEVNSFFMHEGSRYNLLDVFADCDSNTQMGVGDALKMLMFNQGAAVYAEELKEWARDELAKWPDADKAYELHVSINEPQEY